LIILLLVSQDESEIIDKNKENTDSEVKKNAATTNITPTLSVVELYARRQQKLNQRKVRIAELSNAIIEKPEENVGVANMFFILVLIIQNCAAALRFICYIVVQALVKQAHYIFIKTDSTVKRTLFVL
jgi:hypothetical protein